MKGNYCVLRVNLITLKTDYLEREITEGEAVGVLDSLFTGFYLGVCTFVEAAVYNRGIEAVYLPECDYYSFKYEDKCYIARKMELQDYELN